MIVSAIFHGIRIPETEVVRRSVEHADKQSEPKKPDPVAMLRACHAKGGLSPARADKWIAEIREDRKRWRAK
jgi:hypothetical protein